jgi:hypothetical protein
MVLFSSMIFLLMFCLYVLSVNESGMLKSPTVVVSGSTCSFILRSICYMNLGALMFSAYIFGTVIPSCWIVCFISSDHLYLF